MFILFVRLLPGWQNSGLSHWRCECKRAYGQREAGYTDTEI